jgi:hypothetical protein
MARTNTPLVQALLRLLRAREYAPGEWRFPRGVTTQSLLSLALEALGDDATFYLCADDVVWAIARHQGYIIPACPSEARGDAHAFLVEAGVRNAREWYEARGLVLPQTKPQLRYRAITPKALREDLPGNAMEGAAAPAAPAAHDDGLEHASSVEDLHGFSCFMVRNKLFWRKAYLMVPVEDLTPGAFAPLLITALEFALGEATGEDDPTLFTC